MKQKLPDREKLQNDRWWNSFRQRHNVPPVPESVVNDLLQFCRRHQLKHCK